MYIGEVWGSNPMEGYVYILQSQKNGSFYIGSTIVVSKRFVEHNTGLVVATRYLTPWDLVFSQRYETIREARQVEFKLKKLKSRKIIEQIIKDKKIKMGQ